MSILRDRGWQRRGPTPAHTPAISSRSLALSAPSQATFRVLYYRLYTQSYSTFQEAEQYLKIASNHIIPIADKYRHMILYRQ